MRYWGEEEERKGWKVERIKREGEKAEERIRYTKKRDEKRKKMKFKNRYGEKDEREGEKD